MTSAAQTMYGRSYTDVGSIKQREAKAVVAEIMEQRGVPKSVWKLQPGGQLNILIGSRVATFACKSGMTFYQLQHLARDVNRALDEREAAARNRNQTDIEDAIKAAAE